MIRAEHLIDILAEECAETAQRASKALRFGLNETEPGQPFTNAQRLMHEYCDIIAAVDMLVDAELVKFPSDHNQRIAAKRAAVEKHLLLSASLGTLQE